jgi:hypothetical protein
MTLELVIPAHRKAALDWVIDFVLRKVLGLDVRVLSAEADEVVLRAGAQQLVLAATFPDLHADRASWNTQMPAEPLVTADLVALGLHELGHVAPLPVLYGLPTLTIAADRIDCGIDVFGSIFFMLSRFEEVVMPERDVHDRFPATAALALRENFLCRPIVDDYIDFLWVLMHRLWPGLKRPNSNGEVRVSCDVDQPFDHVKSNPMALVRAIIGDLIVRRSTYTAAKRVAHFVTQPFGMYRIDPFYTFDWYMNVCERAGLRASFYFIAENSAGAIDGDYQIVDPRILALMRDIHRRGHEIGLHGSYNTFRDHEQMLRERNRLQDALKSAGLEVEVVGNRQHYLRWDSAVTPDILNTVGFKFDASGGFADHTGFRYGTSRTFAMWSWKSLSPLKLLQRPLVVMERSVFGKQYMNYSNPQEALEFILGMKQSAIHSGGDFTLLWHNSSLLSLADRFYFKKVLGVH